MESYIREAGALLGTLIARHPYRFAILPVCSFCLFFIPFLDSFSQLFREPSAIGSSKLFVPRNSASERDKQKIAKIFPHGVHYYDRTFLSPNLRILNFELLSGSIYEPQFVEFYQNLRNKLELLNVIYNDDIISYSNLCSKASEDGRHCFPDLFLLSNTYLALSQPVQYPIWHLFIYNTSQTIFTGTTFGSVHTEGNSSRIISARCVRMIFDFPPPYHIMKFDDMWDRYVERNLKYPSNIKITKWSRSQYERDMKLIARRTRRLLPLLAFCLICFCCLSSMKCNCNLRFMLLSFYGVLSAACGLVAAFGFLHIIGIHLVQVALVTPFLHIYFLLLFNTFFNVAIGIDDMFIMLSIWEQTISISSNNATDRCDLMRTTFRESIVSILLTTTGNILVFTLGSFAPFPIIRIFCIYSAVSLFVVFLFQLTLFGSLLATTAPNSLDHNLISFPTQQNCSKSNGKIRSSIQTECSRSSLPSLYAKIFKNKYSIALVCLSYAVYLIGSSIILNRKIDIGLQLSSLLPIDTGTYKYLRMYEEYFSAYSTPLEVVLPDESDYFDRHFQWRLFHAIAILENTDYTMKATFWFSSFLDFLRQIESNTERFIANSTLLYEKLAQFLQHPAYRHFGQDIIFEKKRNNTRLLIKSSRLHMPLFNVTRLSRRSAMQLIRRKVKTAEKRYSIRFLTYHVMYDLIEQDNLMPHLVFTNALLAGMASTCAILILTPSLMNCILIIWATFSINFGVLALLNICGTHLDIISATVILLSIGYSVDYSSHMLAHFYHFQQCSKDPIGGTLSIVCWPVVQASLSTIIGVICISPVKGYIVKTFTYGVLFVCCIGLYHSIVVLPAFLAINTYRPKLLIFRQRQYIVESTC
uniref:SSD domain-containing protein n=1 Tax=Onchocerca volvulus TaxID=6282 RepID=A0A8R1Y0P5_ONCVO